ncbi:MAG: hypothetical protein EOO61_18230 [Hymenobacter sp.]|nr:MAG: hypothetical protein EOO61_18230 [Hymenobacter sp.]
MLHRKACPQDESRLFCVVADYSRLTRICSFGCQLTSASAVSMSSSGRMHSGQVRLKRAATWSTVTSASACATTARMACTATALPLFLPTSVTQVLEQEAAGGAAAAHVRKKAPPGGARLLTTQLSVAGCHAG